MVAPCPERNKYEYEVTNQLLTVALGPTGFAAGAGRAGAGAIRSRPAGAGRRGDDQRFFRTVVAKAFWPYWSRIGIRVSRS